MRKKLNGLRRSKHIISKLYFVTYSMATDQYTERKLAFLRLSSEPSISFNRKLAMLVLLRLQVQMGRAVAKLKR
jgi:hypothetical protein